MQLCEDTVDGYFPAHARKMKALRFSLQKKAFHVLLFLCGVRVTIQSYDGAPTDISKPHLLISNHISYLDCVVLAAYFPGNFVAKQEILSWPVIGLVSKLLECLFVERDTLGGRVRAIHQIKDRLKKGSMCVFPEGTTTLNELPRLQNWKSGQMWAALAAKAEVIVAGVHYSQQEKVAWIDDMNFFTHLVSLFKVPTIDAYVTFCTFESKNFEPRDARKASLHAFEKLCLMCEESVQKSSENNEFIEQHVNS
jgi:1-acyl-sn-glycerol-3-phosphate acyltransferase